MTGAGALGGRNDIEEPQSLMLWPLPYSRASPGEPVSMGADGSIHIVWLPPWNNAARWTKKSLTRRAHFSWLKVPVEDQRILPSAGKPLEAWPAEKLGRQPLALAQWVSARA
jgi:hypothetical protein